LTLEATKFSFVGVVFFFKKEIKSVAV